MTALPLGLSAGIGSSWHNPGDTGTLSEPSAQINSALLACILFLQVNSFESNKVA